LALVRELASSKLGRIYFVTGGLALVIIALKLTVLQRVDDPSLAVSLLRGGPIVLVAISLVIAFAARGQLTRRDRFTVPVALITALAVSAADVAHEQRFGVEDVLLDVTGPLLGLTVVAIIWSALGRASGSVQRSA
jgi:hypothetical protein